MCKAYSSQGGKRNVYRALVGKQEGEGPLEIPPYIFNNNIKMDCLHLVHDRAQWMTSMNWLKNLRAPQNFEKRGCDMLPGEGNHSLKYVLTLKILVVVTGLMGTRLNH
jgi:hypothetical protein